MDCDRSFFYSSPKIYKLGLFFILRKNLKIRYELISQKIGKNKKVLEPGCGPVLLKDYLHGSCTYTGFDINKKFIEYARKRKINAFMGDIFNEKNYSKADIVVCCDLIHHIDTPHRKKFLKLCFKYASEKIIICDPFVKDNFKNNSFFNKVCEKLFDYVERDGMNQAKFRNSLTLPQLKKEMENGFGVIPKDKKVEVIKVGSDLIAVYHLDN